MTKSKVFQILGFTGSGIQGAKGSTEMIRAKMEYRHAGGKMNLTTPQGLGSFRDIGRIHILEPFPLGSSDPFVSYWMGKFGMGE